MDSQLNLIVSTTMSFPVFQIQTVSAEPICLSSYFVCLQVSSNSQEYDLQLILLSPLILYRSTFTHDCLIVTQEPLLSIPNQIIPPPHKWIQTVRYEFLWACSPTFTINQPHCAGNRNPNAVIIWSLSLSSTPSIHPSNTSLWTLGGSTTARAGIVRQIVDLCWFNSNASLSPSLARSLAELTISVVSAAAEPISHL